MHFHGPNIELGLGLAFHLNLVAIYLQKMQVA